MKKKTPVTKSAKPKGSVSITPQKAEQIAKIVGTNSFVLVAIGKQKSDSFQTVGCIREMSAENLYLIGEELQREAVEKQPSLLGAKNKKK